MHLSLSRTVRNVESATISKKGKTHVPPSPHDVPQCRPSRVHSQGSSLLMPTVSLRQKECWRIFPEAVFVKAIPMIEADMHRCQFRIVVRT